MASVLRPFKCVKRWEDAPNRDKGEMCVGREMRAVMMLAEGRNCGIRDFGVCHTSVRCQSGGEFGWIMPAHGPGGRRRADHGGAVREAPERGLKAWNPNLGRSTRRCFAPADYGVDTLEPID